MKIFDKIKMAWNDILNRKLRSMLTIIAISVGALLLIVMMGFGDGIMKQTETLMDSFGNANEINVYPSVADMASLMVGSTSMMTIEEPMIEENSSEAVTIDPVEKVVIHDSDLEKITKVDGVDYIRAMINSTATSVKIDNGNYVDKKVDLVGVNFKFNNDFTNELLAGTGFSTNENEVIIGEKYLKRINVDNAQDVIGKSIAIKIELPILNEDGTNKIIENNYKIVGVVEKDSTYSANILMNAKDVEKIIGGISGKDNYISENGYTNIIAYAKEGYDITEVSSKITSECGYETFSMAFISNMLEVMTTVVKSILSIAGIIVLVVAGLGLVNTMSMILQEKRKMIGVMRSVGASRGSIRLIFIFQSFLLGIFGGILGTILAGIGIFIVNNFVFSDNSFIISFTLGNVTAAIIITLIISIIAGLIPSSNAARLNVVQAVAEE